MSMYTSNLNVNSTVNLQTLTMAFNTINNMQRKMYISKSVKLHLFLATKAIAAPCKWEKCIKVCKSNRTMIET